MRRLLLVLSPALLLAFPRGSAAQLAPELGVSLFSAYAWRGLTVVSRPVVQPQVTLAAGPAALGVWANLEPVAYRGADDLTALAGRSAPGLTEVDPSVEIGGAVGTMSVTAGAVAYLFTHAAGYATAPNTAELYGRARLAGAIPLELDGYLDVHAVRGLYLEAGLQRPLPGLPALLLGARAGASFGETQGPETSYFERDGITHVELSATLPFALGPLRLTPVANVDFGVDPAARVASRTSTRRAKLWAGLSVGWPGKGE